MVEPTGYTALDLIGFTDKGTYNPATNYVKNDLVHYGGSIWRVLIDDTIGITPAEGLHYTFFVGEPTNLVERIMAPLEQNPATQNWTVGRQIINNDYLYEVIAPIAIGDNLVAYEDDPVNANIKLAPPIETQVLDIKHEADKTEDMIAPSETNPAGSSHSVGDKIIFDNILYDVTSAIAATDALVAYPTAGYNIKPSLPLGTEIQALTNFLNDVAVKPEDYGAVGDGVADDTVALQAALDTLHNVSLTGKYLVTSDLIIKHDGSQPEYEKQIIVGGRIILHNATIKGNSNFNGGVAFVNVCFTSDGHYTKPGITFDNCLIRTKFILCKFRLIDYVIDGTTSAPAFIQEAQFINCHFQDGVKAIMLDNAIFAIKIKDCNINNYSAYGIEFGSSTSAQNVIIDGNVLENNDIAIKLNHILKNVVIEKNYFEGNDTASIDLTWLETDGSSNCSGVAIRENYFYLDNNKDSIYMPYRIAHKLSDYVNGSVVPITFERNSSTRGTNQTQSTYYIPNGTPSKESLDFKFDGYNISSLEPYLHKYETLMIHRDFVASQNYNAGDTVRLLDNADLLTAIGRSSMPTDFAVAIRNTTVKGIVYVVASTGHVAILLSENMTSGQSITWSFIYK